MPWEYSERMRKPDASPSLQCASKTPWDRGIVCKLVLVIYSGIYVCICIHSHIIYTYSLKIGIYAHIITYTFNMGTHMHTGLWQAQRLSQVSFSHLLAYPFQPRAQTIDNIMVSYTALMLVFIVSVAIPSFFSLVRQGLEPGAHAGGAVPSHCLSIISVTVGNISLFNLWFHLCLIDYLEGYQ